MVVLMDQFASGVIRRATTRRDAHATGGLRQTNVNFELHCTGSCSAILSDHDMIRAGSDKIALCGGPGDVGSEQGPRCSPKPTVSYPRRHRDGPGMRNTVEPYQSHSIILSYKLSGGDCHGERERSH